MARYFVLATTLFSTNSAEILEIFAYARDSTHSLIITKLPSINNVLLLFLYIHLPFDKLHYILSAFL